MVPDTGCKLDETIARHDLETADPRHESIDRGLLARWNGTGGHSQTGYRTLTEWFNKRLLKRVYDEHGRDSSDPQIDADFTALTNDDALVREEMIERLSAEGIDGEQLRADMISWGTMRTHLVDCLGGSKERSSARTDWERNSIETAQNKLVDTVDEALSSLETKDDLHGVSSSTVEAQVQLRCNACPTRVPLDVALERGYVCERHSRTDDTAHSTTTQQ